MSLDASKGNFHLENVIMKSLNIHSVEYCYFIPIVSQLADYWGDIKLAILFNILSRKIKQHFNQAIHIHLLLSAPFWYPCWVPKGRMVKKLF